VLGTAVDYSGVTRAKAVPVGRVGVFIEVGMGASPSWVVFCVDQGIAFTPELGVIGDLRLRIDSSRVTVVDTGVAWAPGNLHHQDGSPFPGCPRRRLQDVVAEMADAGLTARTGTELEFVVTARDGSRRGGSPWQGYGVRTALDLAPFLADVVETFATADVPIEQLHMEYGADQVEVSLAPADPVTIADRTILGRILIGRAAARGGWGVSFAPVPFEGSAGNGAHLHLSMTQNDTPLFHGGSGPHGMTAAGAAAIAGLVAGIPEMQGILAGSVGSPLRLRPGNWAGAFDCWGLENREAALRFIQGTQANPDGANVELKAVDGSANPYLAAATLLGLAHDGIQQNLALPEEITVNPATLPADHRDSIALASDQGSALDRLEASGLARKILGNVIVDGTLSVRRYEQRTYGSAPAGEVADVLRMAFSC
jgi:glutamine synthetase